MLQAAFGYKYGGDDTFPVFLDAEEFDTLTCVPKAFSWQLESRFTFKFEKDAVADIDTKRTLFFGSGLCLPYDGMKLGEKALAMLISIALWDGRL
jgi:hypothetical protein